MITTTSEDRTALLRLPDDLLRRMSSLVDDHDRDEMAIPSYLHRNPALRWMAWRRLHVLADRIVRVLDRPRNEPGSRPVAMDFGCGTGVLLPTLARRCARVHAVDLQLEPAKLLVAELGLEGVELWHPDAAADGIEPGTVDLVVAGEVLEHVEPIPPALERFARWLRPQGTLLVSLPTESALYRFGRRLAGFSGHYHHANAATIHAAITAFGFIERARWAVPAPGPLAIYWVVEYAPGPRLDGDG
jgi:SAM-dependent methyltransferase